MSFDKDLLVPCPVVTPSMEEFADPIKYLSNEENTRLGSEYGIIKVVPPKGWQPAFLLSPEFKFHTRLQKLSDLGLTTRSRKFFTDNINRFLRMRSKRPLRLYFRVGQYDAKDNGTKRLKVYYYDLHVLVEKYGGFDSMDENKWSQVNEHFGVKNNSRNIEHEYITNLRSYAYFLSHNQRGNNDFPESDSEDDFDNCLICGKHDKPSLTLLCDNCDNPFHITCLDPPLPSVPAGSWYCDKCLIGTGEYGFEEEVDLKYSIPEFYQLCKEFEEKFKHEYNQDKALTVDMIEQKFWEFVDVEKSDLEVRYGADIHNLKPGEISGFPMTNTPGIKRNDPSTNYYINHPWNLTKLPFAEGSLLNYINTSISGMTVPWIYIGSLLSTFCWHVEDHYTLSANYCHFGATKKWYGIPSFDADRFEKLMKDSAPDLFQKQPDLLHQLVTLLSPMTLVKNGIKCVYADQGPNEFIITYPRVYHAGFNCGFNFNEAVNFTMDSWLHFGEKSIHDYRLIKKENVFNHYQLVENILKSVYSDGRLSRPSHSLVEASLKCMENFTAAQSKYLGQITGDNFTVKYAPRVFKERKFEDEQIGTFDSDSEAEDDEDLCDVCRTHISFQYCIVNNESGDYFSAAPPSLPSPRVKHEPPPFTKIPIHQLLTPESSPYDHPKPHANANPVHRISDSKSSRSLSSLRDDAARVSEEEQFQHLVRTAKRDADDAHEAVKRRKSSRLESRSKHLDPVMPTSRNPRPGKMTAVQIKSHLKHLNLKPRLRLCLPCLLVSCHNNPAAVPSGSLLLYELSPSTMLGFLAATKLKLAFMPLDATHI